MCGRAYTTYTDEELHFHYLNRAPRKLRLSKPNYNLSPTQNSQVLRIIDGEPEFEEMHWQLIPRWETAFTTRFLTVNAKSESVFESALFKGLIGRQRCIVPLSGFFEWKKEETTKRPFKIHLQDQSIMSVAGLWDTWGAGGPEERRSFTLLTTAANDAMREIHDRMPVILGRDQIVTWLDPEVHDRDTLQKLLQPCPDSWLTSEEVSTLVNSPQNNSPEVLLAL